MNELRANVKDIEAESIILQRFHGRVCVMDSSLIDSISLALKYFDRFIR